MWSSLAFWGGSGRETKGKERVSWLIDAHTHSTMRNHTPKIVGGFMCVWVHLSVHAAHMWVSTGSSILYLKISLPLQFLNKACSVKWRKNTRESIIQLSRFPQSLQTKKNSEFDHCIGVGAGERDCFYQHKLCFNRKYSAVSPLGWQSCSVDKTVRVKQKHKECEAERDLRNSGVNKIKKVLLNFERQSLT